MARIDMSSVPMAASFTVSCSEPSCPFRNRVAVCLPPDRSSKASTNALPVASWLLPPLSPTAILNIFASAAPVLIMVAVSAIAAPYVIRERMVIRSSMIAYAEALCLRWMSFNLSQAAR